MSCCNGNDCGCKDKEPGVVPVLTTENDVELRKIALEKSIYFYSVCDPQKTNIKEVLYIADAFYRFLNSGTVPY